MEELIRKRFERAQQSQPQPQPQAPQAQPPRRLPEAEAQKPWRRWRFHFFALPERAPPAQDAQEMARVREVGQDPELLVALLNDSNEKVQRAASDRLVALGIDAAPALLKAMEEGGPRQQSLALWTVRRANAYHPAMFSALHKMATHADQQVRANACAVLARSDVRAVVLLTAALEDEVALVRATAANGLAQHGPAAEEAVPFLTDLLADESAQVRTNAVAALGKIGPWAARFALEDLLVALADPYPQVRDWSIWTLTQLDDEAIPLLTEALIDRRESIRSGVAEALGRMGSRAAPHLERLLDHADPKVRAWSATALARIGLPAESAAPKLLELASHDENAEVRYYAQAALSSMGRTVRQ
jgi:HEAT repeat protein